MSTERSVWDRISDKALHLDADGRIEIVLGEDVDPARFIEMAESAQLLRRYKDFVIAERRLYAEVVVGYRLDFGKSNTIPWDAVFNPIIEAGLFEDAFRRHKNILALAEQINAMPPEDIPPGALESVLYLAKEIPGLVQRIEDANRRLLTEHPPLETPQGYIYLIRSLTSVTHWKIGRTNDPSRRAATFGVELPFDVEYEHIIPSSNAKWAEDTLHTKYKRVRIRGEWFQLSPEQVEEIKRIKWL